MYFIGNIESGTVFQSLQYAGAGTFVPIFNIKEDEIIRVAVFYSRDKAVEMLENIKSRNPNGDSSVHPIEALAQLK